MNKLIITAASILIAAILVSGASAITMESFDMEISENGDALVAFTYSLSPLEKFAVFMKMTDPAAELKRMIDEKTDKEVEVLEVSSGEASFFISEFISPKSDPEGSIYITPAIDFSKAEKILAGYWFAPLITIDLSPEITTVTFPDGYYEVFSNTLQIPSIKHTINQ